MEFVARTTTAVAVDESLTTLIDWVSIELFAGFTLIVENVGGGAAHDITDCQIDTSDDAGAADINLDQHADCPAVPIAAGNSPSGAFTETKKFVRIRALCAVGEDTTAKAFLLASSAQGRICTLADIKERLGKSSAEYDIALNRIILGIEEIFNNHCKRPLIITAADQTEYYTGRSSYLQLDRYPVAAITSVKIAPDYDFASAEALVADTGYRLIAGGKKGIIYRPYLTWPDTPDVIQVISRGGYCAAGAAPGTGETMLPADLREAAIEQASFIFKRRDDIGLAGISFEGGSFSKFSSVELLKNVRAILDNNYLKPTL